MLKKFSNIIKTFIKNIKANIFSLILICIIILICSLHAYEAQKLLDFNPINGTFQNYNPIRRYLNGQIPYKDFTTYLGLGHLYIGSFLTWLYGGTFAASLTAFTFITIISFVMYSICIGDSILLSKNASMVITIILLILLLNDFIPFSGVFDSAIKSCLSPGNSARFIRGMIPALYILCLKCVYKLAEYISTKHAISERNYYIVLTIGISMFAGISFTYSNDYGISTWVCALIVFLVVVFSKSKSLVQCIICAIVYIVLSVASLALFITMITDGNFGNWIGATFGTGGYQTWYYLGSKSYFIYHIDFSFVTVLQLLFSTLYLLKIYRNQGTILSCKRYGIPAFLNLTAFCAENEYKLLSGGIMHEVSYSIIFLTILYEFINALAKSYNNEILKSTLKKICIFCGLCFLSWISTYGVDLVRGFRDSSRGIYIEEMGGYIDELGQDLIETKEYIGNKKVFATYSSALETITDQFQPSGYDYIIHVLGDEARDKYLDSFQENNYDYVATINENFTEWEYWVRNANWFFYRELYKDYHPVYKNEYEMFWKRNDENGEFVFRDLKANIEIFQLSPHSCKIEVKCDKEINGVADILVDYKSKKNEQKRNKLLFFQHVKATSPYPNKSENDIISNNFNLRKSSTEYIPITIIDGYGELVLSSIPEDFTSLTVNSAECKDVYTALYSHIKIEQIESIDSNYCWIKVKNTELNEEISKDITSIIIDGNKSIDIVNKNSTSEYINYKINMDGEYFNEILGGSNMVEVK